MKKMIVQGLFDCLKNENLCVSRKIYMLERQEMVLQPNFSKIYLYKMPEYTKSS